MIQAITTNLSPFGFVASHICDRADLAVILIPWVSLGTKNSLKFYFYAVYREADLPVTLQRNSL